MSEMHDPYEDQLAAARYMAERDQARQKLAIERIKRQRMGRTVWRLQNRLSRAHRRERQLRKGLRMWREKAIEKPQVTMSAYDLLPEEDREAVEWVRDHGGLDAVETRWDNDTQLADAVIYALWPYGIPDGGGNEDVMDELSKRLMPEGMEWPRYDTGEPLKLDDEVAVKNCEPVTVRFISFDKNGFSVRHTGGCREHWFTYGERVKRPAPKVLDADGAEIRVGDTVYGFAGQQYEVTGLCEYEPSIVHAKTVGDGVAADELLALSGQLNSAQLEASKLTHRAPVPAADGKPLREGETVWGTGREEHEYVVLGQPGLGGGAGRFKVACHDVTDDVDCDCDPDQLTHERPDSWELLEEDAEKKDPCSYFGFDGEETCGKCPASGKNCEQTMARDLVRRCRALAERERSE